MMYNLRIMKTKSLYLTVAIGMMLGLASCNMDYYPSDEQSSDVIIKESSSTIMDGCYSLLKDEIEYLGWPSGNTYCRHFSRWQSFRQIISVCPVRVPTRFSRQRHTR